MSDRQQVEVDEREEIVGRVAAIDLAKASGMVCTRVPHATKAGKRRTTVWQVPRHQPDPGVGRPPGQREDRAGRGLGPPPTTGGRSSTCWRRGDWWCGWSTPTTSSPAGPAKTDKLDAVWLAKLNERGMLRPLFVPPAQIRRLREDTRLRADLTADRSRHKQRLEQAAGRTP